MAEIPESSTQNETTPDEIPPEAMAMLKHDVANNPKVGPRQLAANQAAEEEAARTGQPAVAEDMSAQDANPYFDHLDRIDAEDEAAAAPAVNPYLGVIDAIDQEDAAVDHTLQLVFDHSLRLHHGEAGGGYTDKHAQILKMSEITGVKPSTVELSFDDFAKQAASANFDPKVFRHKFPGLAEYILHRPALADVAMHDPALDQLAADLRPGAVVERPSQTSEFSQLVGTAFRVAEDVLAHPFSPGKSAGAKDPGHYTPVEAPGLMTNDPLATAPGLLDGPDRGIADRFADYHRREAGIAAKVFQESSAGLEQSGLAGDIVFRKLAGKDTWLLEKNLQEKKNAVAPPAYFNLNPAEKFFVADAMEMAASSGPSMAAQGVAGVAGGLVGGGLGALASKATGVPGLAKRGYALGSTAVGRTAGFAVAFRQETGSAWLAFSRLTTDKGTLLDEDTALTMSVLYGGMAAAVEVAGNEMAFAAYGPIANLVRKGNTAAFAEELFKHPRVMQRLLSAGKEWGKGGLAEGAQEATQTTLQNIIGWGGKGITDGEWQKADLAGAVVDATESGVKALAGSLTSAGPVMSFNMLSQDFARARDATTVAARQVEALTAAAKKSRVAKADPQAFAHLVEQQTAESGLPTTHLYVTTGELRKLFQSGGVSEAEGAARLMGPDGPRRLQTAIDTGQKLEVPVAEYTEKWADTPIADKLKDHITTRSYLETAAEALAADATSKEQHAALLDQYKKAHAERRPVPAQSSAEQEFLDELEQQLIRVKVSSERTAKDGTKVTVQKSTTVEQAEQQNILLRAGIRTLGERSGKGADALFREAALKIRVRNATPAEMVETGDERMSQGDKSRPAPASHGVQFEHYTKLAEVPEGQEREFFTDINTGLQNKRGLEATPRDPQRPFLAEWEDEGAKLVNDKVGHSSRDAVLRSMGRILGEHIPDGALVGGSIRGWVKSKEQAEEIAAAMQKSLEAAGIRLRITSAVSAGKPGLDETMTATGDSHAAYKKGEFDAGRIGHRQGIPSGYAAGAPQIAFEKGQPGLGLDHPDVEAFIDKVTEELRGPVGKLKEDGSKAKPFPLSDNHRKVFEANRDTAFETIYRENGLNTADGFHHAQEKNRKKHTASGDMRGLKALNTLLGKPKANIILRAFLLALADNDGHKYDAAHLHGDEIAGQGDDEAMLDAYFKVVQEKLGKQAFVMEIPAGPEGDAARALRPEARFVLVEGVHFVYGIGKDFDEADGPKLRAAKKLQGTPAGPQLLTEKELGPALARLRSGGIQATELGGVGEGSEGAVREGAAGGAEGASAAPSPEGLDGRRPGGAAVEQPQSRGDEAQSPRRLNQSVALREGRETLARFGIIPGQTHNTRDIAVALEERQRAKFGTIERNDFSEAAAKKIAKWMAAEVAFEHRPENAGKNGVGWYSTKWQAALDHFAELFPELKKDQAARDVFTALVAVTSDGEKVYTNFKNAAEVYAGYRKTGRIPLDAFGSKRASTTNAIFERINDLLEQLGPEGMRDLLLEERSISELKKLAQAQGGEFSSGYKADTKMPMAALVFGPKLGAFYANLMGSHGYLTMDRWWSRTFNRYRGQLIPAPTRPGLDRLKALLGKPRMSDEAAIQRTVALRKSYEAKDFKDGTELEKAANTIYKAAFEELEDTPFNASDRDFMMRTVDHARKGLAQEGIEVSVADIQAVLWYYEKRLYSELGARSSADVSYQEVARRVVGERAGRADGRPGGPGSEGRGVPGSPRRLAQGVRKDVVEGPDGAAFELPEADSGEVADPHAERFNASGDRGFVKIAKAATQRVFEILVSPTKGDLSTVLHESGHIYLELLGDVAQMPDTPQAVKDDYKAILDWLGVAYPKDATGTRLGELMASVQIAREQHEQFARGFEAYLMEGKAPSAALEKPFRRFKSWLKRIYKTVAGLDVELNDEVRGVFDRLLATDAEIEAAKSEAGLAPMWSSLAEAIAAGLSPAEAQLYLDSQVKATAHAEAAARLKELREKLKATRGELKAREKRARTEAETAYNTHPATRAVEALAGGKLRDDLGDVVLEEIGQLHRTEVVDAIGEQATRQLEATLGKSAWKNWAPAYSPATSAEEAAALLGFATAKDMLEAAASHPDKTTWVRQQVAEKMKASSAELQVEHERLKADVEKGIHGDATAEWLLLELKALRSRAEPGATPTLAAFKAAAKTIVAQHKAGTLNPTQALRAERSSAEKAMLATAKGNHPQALIHKQQQILNMFIGRELRAAAEMRDSFLDLAGKLSKDSARARLGLSSPTYRDVVDTILEAVAVAEPRPRDTQPAGVDAAVAQMEGDGISVHFDVDAVRALLAQPRDWKTLTVAELENLFGALKQIKKAATDRSKVLVGENLEDKDIAVAAWVAELEEALPPLKAPTEAPARGLLENGMSLYSAYDGELLPVALLVDWMGGRGHEVTSMAYRMFMAPLQAAKVKEADILRTVVSPIVEAFKKLPLARMSQVVDGKVLFPDHSEKLQPPSRMFQIFVMALNAGNAENKQRLLDGRQITEAQLQAALDLLTKEEMDVVQLILDQTNSLWPASRALEERMSGLAPPKIEATPITTKHGTWTGGYFPAVYSPSGRVGKVQTGGTLAEFSDPSFVRPGTPHSHLKKRADSVTDLIALDPSTIGAHLAKVAHDLAYREAVSSIGRLLLDERVQGALARHLGEEKAKIFVPWLKDVAVMGGAQVLSQTPMLDRLMTGARANVGAAVMGFAHDIAIGNVANLAVNATFLKPKHFAAGMWEFASRPLESAAFAREHFGEWRVRENRVLAELRDDMKRMTSQFPRATKGLQVYQELASAFLETVDKATVLPLFLGAYRQGMAEALAKGMEGRAAEKFAVDFTSHAVLKLTPSKMAVDQAAFLRPGSKAGFLIVFYGYFNKMRSLYRDYDHDVVLAFRQGDGVGEKAVNVAKEMPRWFGRHLALGIAFGTLGTIMTKGKWKEPDEPDEDALRRHLLMLPLQRFTTAPGLGALVEPIASKLATGRAQMPSARTAPSLAVVEQIGKVAFESFDDGDPAKAALAALRVAALAKGFSVERPIRAGKYLDGDEKPDNPLEFLHGITYPKSSRQPQR